MEGFILRTILGRFITPILGIIVSMIILKRDKGEYELKKTEALDNGKQLDKASNMLNIKIISLKGLIGMLVMVMISGVFSLLVAFKGDAQYYMNISKIILIAITIGTAYSMFRSIKSES